MDLFDTNALCTVNSEEIKGPLNLLSKLLNNGILKINYNNLIINSQPLSDSNILVLVNGKLLTNGIEITGSWTQFSEVFTLSKNGNNYFIKNYILNTNIV